MRPTSAERDAELSRQRTWAAQTDTKLSGFHEQLLTTSDRAAKTAGAPPTCVLVVCSTLAPVPCGSRVLRACSAFQLPRLTPSSHPKFHACIRCTQMAITLDLQPRTAIVHLADCLVWSAVQARPPSC